MLDAELWRDYPEGGMESLYTPGKAVVCLFPIPEYSPHYFGGQESIRLDLIHGWGLCVGAHAWSHPQHHYGGRFGVFTWSGHGMARYLFNQSWLSVWGNVWRRGRDESAGRVKQATLYNVDGPHPVRQGPQ